MRIEILSGNQKGQIVDLPQTEAECSIATGYARSLEEAVPQPAQAAAAPASKPTTPKAPKGKATPKAPKGKATPKGAKRTGT